MTVAYRPCAICAAEAKWICVRKPSAGELDLLCDRHYERLQARNPILGARYDRVPEVTAPTHEEDDEDRWAA